MGGHALWLLFVAIGKATATMRAMQISRGAAVRLSVSLVLHNSPLALLERALDSLGRAAQQAPSLGALEVVLVDNASTDDYRRELAAMLESRLQFGLQNLQLRLLEDNRGFGAGHNTVLLHTDSDYHLVLNPDVELDEQALQAGLARLLAAPDIALVSPRVVNGDGQPEFLCKTRPSVLTLALRGFAPPWVKRFFRARLEHYEMRDACSADNEVEVAIASGCFMLARTSALRAVGGFNAAFFLYFEDFDLSLRLAGQGKLLFLPSMRIVHHGGYAASKGGQHIRWFVGSAMRYFHLHGWRWL